MSSQKYIIGIDIGSTTVKYVICDLSFNIIAKNYRKHNTKQAQTLLELLEEVEPKIFNSISKTYITGSGASPIAPTLNARFIQEVNAVVIAVEYLHLDVHSVIELGGQDAKIIHFKSNSNGSKSVITSMNDKCASGTGATIEKSIQKVGISKDIYTLKFNQEKLHNVSSKCGVFAETDIVNLVKTSVPANEIMNSLADAIVMQNLTVLTKGNTLKPNVLLLGGPNRYLPFLKECWQVRIKELWDEREINYDKTKIEELIKVPENGEYYGALGSVIFGEKEANHTKNFNGLNELKELIKNRDVEKDFDTPLIKNENELLEFKKEFSIPKFKTPILKERTNCYLGIDGGSTSSKAILINENGDVVFKAYQLSKGNPIEDTLELLTQVKNSSNSAFYNILGLGVTGYAGEVLKGALNADINIIETIAHLKSSQHIFKEIDVICDIGGQDIKVLFIENGMMKNFRLSNQCSAGNGMLLQSMAKQFAVPIEEFANLAFSAKKSPKFNYGCAVFLDTDRVNFQKEGYSKEELFAGIAKVLPKNVWQYVVQAPNLKVFGKNFVLQGGTQYNLSALKSQVDYIKARVPNANIKVHPHSGEAGALGAALKSKEITQKRGFSTFVGLDEGLKMTYNSYTNEDTRCNFCSINCSRTFIKTKTPLGKEILYIAGFSCEEGTVESIEELKKLKENRLNLQKEVPNLVKKEAYSLFAPTFDILSFPTNKRVIEEQKVKVTLNGFGPTFRKNIKRDFKISSAKNREFRLKTKIAIPKVLNIYSVAPFIRTYLEALGVDRNNILFSTFTNEKMFLEGAKYGSVDPCYPAKVVQSHIYSFLFEKKYQKKGIDFIWFPAITHLKGFLKNVMAQTSCPIVSGTPKVILASFTKEQNLFAKQNIDYVDEPLNFDDLKMLEKHLFATWKDRLKITKDENRWAIKQGLKALELNEEKIMQEGKKILEEAEENKEIVIVLLGRPYHSDFGLNHDILDEFQSLGFKTISMRAIPKDEEYLLNYFSKDIEKGYISSVFDIRDVWEENFSTNSAQKVWSAKFASRHPNIAVVDISSFKCGHDAPTYAIIDKILSTSKTPHLTLHDFDANKPAGSLKIRVKTFAYTLNEYKKSLEENSYIYK